MQDRPAVRDRTLTVSVVVEGRLANLRSSSERPSLLTHPSASPSDRQSARPSCRPARSHAHQKVIHPLDRQSVSPFRLPIRPPARSSGFPPDQPPTRTSVDPWPSRSHARLSTRLSVFTPARSPANRCPIVYPADRPPNRTHPSPPSLPLRGPSVVYRPRPHARSSARI